ncbi:MAG: diaminopimelate epimerase [Acidimicrobiia bacterium]
MNFTKMEGLGNDFVVLEGPFAPSAEDIERMCDRRRGIGADGILVVTPRDGRRVRMEYWNADGSPAEMCGNGLRCVAAFASRRGFVTGSEFTVETAVGPRSVRLGEGAITVELGPVQASHTLREVEGSSLRAVSVGNPHAVVRVEDPAHVRVEEVGPRIEAAFEEGVNVEFMTVRAPGVLDVRVWERGVGETLACGTGAAAAVAAACAEGLVGQDATVRLPGGDLGVHMEDDVAWITGPARFVFEGEWHG